MSFRKVDCPGMYVDEVARAGFALAPDVLERMLTLRIHLDDCDAENGALRVIPESHARGLLSDEQIQDIMARADPTVCEARRGTVLAMRPQLLHSSAPATSPSHRRVVHLEFVADALPGGLEWPHQV